MKLLKPWWLQQRILQEPIFLIQQRSYSWFLNFLSDPHQYKVIWLPSAFNLKQLTLIRVISTAVTLTATPWQSRLIPVNSPCRNQSYLVCCWRTFYILLITHFGQMSPPHTTLPQSYFTLHCSSCACKEEMHPPLDP